MGDKAPTTAPRADPSTWTDVERSFVQANPDLKGLYEGGHVAVSPTQYMSYAQGYKPEDMQARAYKDIEKHFKYGERDFHGYGRTELMSQDKYDPGTWVVDPRKVGQTGLFNQRSSPYNTSPWTMAQNYDIYNRWDTYQGVYAQEQAAEQARIQAYADEQAALQAAGAPAWEIDPTPGDTEITTQDKITQMAAKQEHLQTLLDAGPEITTGHETQLPNVEQPTLEPEPTPEPEPEIWLNDRGETREEEAARLAQEEAELIRQRTMEGEQAELGDLWGKRSQSEALARKDAANYLLDMSTSMILQGVKPPFTKPYQETLERHRFGQYWSEENEARMMHLAEGTQFKHGLPGKVKLKRLEKELPTNVSQTAASQMQAQIESGAATTPADLMVTGLLEEDLELLEAKQYLGG